MKNTKKDVIQFLTWMRNGIAFCTSWFLILWLLYNYFYGIETITTAGLFRMLLFVTGGVFLFSVCFTRFIVKKWRFLTRLTCFMVLISIYECVSFYAMGLWGRRGSAWEWIGFAAVILILYVICIGIYKVYSKKQGEIYTRALQKYQYKRSVSHGE